MWLPESRFGAAPVAIDGGLSGATTDNTGGLEYELAGDRVPGGNLDHSRNTIQYSLDLET